MAHEYNANSNANDNTNANANDNVIANNPYPTGVDPMMYSLGVEYALERLEPNDAVEWEDPSFRAGYYLIMSAMYGIAANQVLSAYMENNGISTEEFIDLMHEE